ncbi:MAG: PAS domain S-box protein [Proteobacteria bacterium]|nr:PAS domain S-box protein [Pseudomonadota bacterium]NIS68137.1 PAS domain S-box protein [Pseudomonadota bacterium]
MKQAVRPSMGEKVAETSTEQFTRSRNGVHLLKEAFSIFDIATARLEKSHQDLEKRIKSLDRALEEKNRELEKNLEETERVRSYLQNILESLNSGVMVLDSSGRVTTVNDAVQIITGFDSDEITGKNLSDLGIFDDCFMETLKRIMANPTQGCNCEMQVMQKDGQSVRVNLSSSPMKNSQNRISGRVIVFQDIERLKALEEQAQRTGRLSAMGEMAARIAHEIRNPLGSIELFASLLKRELEGDRKRLAEHLINGVKTLNTILTNLFYFFRGPLEAVRIEMDLHRFLSDFLEEMTHVTEKNRVTIRRDFSREAFTLRGDPELLKQLFLNLLLNAIQAMPDGGEIRISTRLIREQVEILRPKFTDPPPAGFLEVRVSDLGSGIPKEIQSRIFDPFFTTRDTGAGLGLATAHNIMEAHGGMIRVVSGKQQGATFLMTFPLHRGNRKVKKTR